MLLQQLFPPEDFEPHPRRKQFQKRTDTNGTPSCRSALVLLQQLFPPEDLEPHPRRKQFQKRTDTIGAQDFEPHLRRKQFQKRTDTIGHTSCRSALVLLQQLFPPEE